MLSAWRATFPETFLRAQLSAYTLWLSPSDSSGFVSATRARLGGYAPPLSIARHAHAAGFTYASRRRGGLAHAGLPQASSRRAPALVGHGNLGVSWTNVALHLLALTGFIWAIWSGQRIGDRSRITCAAVAGSLLFVKLLVMSNLLEFGENERFGAYEAFPSLLLLAQVGL